MRTLSSCRPGTVRRSLLGLMVGGALLTLAGMPAASAKEWDTIRFATEGAFPPYNFTKPDGTLGGFEIDFVQDICRRIKAKCEVVAQNWDGIMPGLTGGKYDAIIAGMAITAKRREVIDFTVPYVSAPTRFGTLKGGGLEDLPGTGARFNLTTDEAGATAAIDALKARLKGKTLGLQLSTIQADFANTYLKGTVEIRSYKTSDDILLDLAAGRVDAMLASAANIQAAIDKPGGQDLVFTGPGFGGGVIGIGTGIGVRKTDPELLALLDGAIKDARADGTIARLSTQWFKLDLTPR